VKPTENDSFDETNVAYQRLYSILVAICYPGWSLFLAYFDLSEHDEPAIRIVIGLFSASICLLSYKVEFVKKYLNYCSYFTAYVVATHFTWMFSNTDQSAIYMLGYMIFVATFSTFFTTMSSLVLYSIYTLCILSISFLPNSGITMIPSMLIGGVCTFQFLAAMTLAVRISVFSRLKDSEREKLTYKQKIIAAELESASLVQSSLLLSPPDIDTIKIDCFYQSAAQTGGDWYGFYQEKNETYLHFWIGDVTGHGYPSALMTGVVCGTIYSGEKRIDILENNNQPLECRMKEAAKVLNQVINETQSNLLMTMFFGCIDLETGELYHINASHNFPSLLKKDGTVEQILNNGSPLGFNSVSEYKVKKTKLEVGDELILMTDGLFENVGPNGDNLGQRQFSKLLTDGQNSELSTIEEILLSAENIWLGAPGADDVAIVTLKLQGLLNKSKKSA
jgi:serine phosphatase RsbU (regulator of sigma subunit)